MPYGLMNRIPYTLPDNIAPPGTRCIQITIPDDDQWENQLNSLIRAEFGRWLMWERDVGKNGTKVAGRWRIALKTWQHCDNTPSPVSDGMEIDEMAGLIEPYCDDQGNCRFHFRCDICGDWHDVALTSDLIANPDATGNQPAPGGGNSTYCKKLQANASVLIPTPVSTGDTIQITSYDGAGADGSGHWYCGDGNTFFIACTGTGAAADSGDPVNTAAHMSFIVRLGSAYYALLPYATPFTVPGGVVNVQPEIQINDSDLTNNAGDYDICVEVTNNQTPSWCHTWDFTTSPAGWSSYYDVAHSVDYAVWTPGSGWTRNPPAVGDHDESIAICSPVLTGLTISTIKVVMSNYSGDTAPQAYFDKATSVCVYSGSHIVIGSTAAVAGVINVLGLTSLLSDKFLVEYYGEGTLIVPSAAAIKSVTVTGTGVPPVSSNC